MKKIIVGAIALTAITASLTGCAKTASLPPVGDCVNVIVDYSSLNPTGDFSQCVVVDGEVHASDLLKKSGFDIVGTDKYPAEIVCRVNDFPSATKPLGIKDHEDYVEPCKNMPPEFGYWALLVKSHSGKWDWAPTGIAQIHLIAGDSVALVFAENGNVNFPE
jgi:hypothetical protein